MIYNVCRICRISNPSELILRAGIWDLTKTKVEDYLMQQRVASVIKSHPRYTSPDPIVNDIAIIQVNQPFKFSTHVQKICLDNGSQRVSKSGCFGTGWGAESFETQTELSQFLKKVPMNQVDHAVCEKQLGSALRKENFVLPESFLCAGGNKFDLCIGDSGSPFICPIAGETNKFVLTGLTSYGIKCFTETPGVYTKVVKFIDWIRDELEVAFAY